MEVEPSGEDMPPRIEFWNQYDVPEINIRIAGLDGLHGVHDQNACLVKMICLNAIAAAAEIGRCGLRRQTSGFRRHAERRGWLALHPWALYIERARLGE
jgi:hypothetical protein